MDPYVSCNQSTLQPGPARSVQPAQKRPWKPSMVPSSQAGSMPPRPAGATGPRRLARPAEGQTQVPSQPRMTMSQPNSFQEYAPSGTPDRQYMLPGDQRQPQNGSATYYMASSQPSSGVLSHKMHQLTQTICRALQIQLSSISSRQYVSHYIHAF